MVYSLLLVLPDSELPVEPVELLRAPTKKHPAGSPVANIAAIQSIACNSNPASISIAQEASAYFFSSNIIHLTENPLAKTLIKSNLPFNSYYYITKAEVRLFSRRRGVFLSQWGFPTPAVKLEETLNMPNLRELRIISVFAPSDCLYEDQADQRDIRGFVNGLQRRGVVVVKDFEAIPAP